MVLLLIFLLFLQCYLFPEMTWVRLKIYRLIIGYPEIAFIPLFIHPWSNVILQLLLIIFVCFYKIFFLLTPNFSPYIKKWKHKLTLTFWYPSSHLVCTSQNFVLMYFILKFILNLSSRASNQIHLLFILIQITLFNRTIILLILTESFVNEIFLSKILFGTSLSLLLIRNVQVRII